MDGVNGADNGVGDYPDAIMICGAGDGTEEGLMSGGEFRGIASRRHIHKAGVDHKQDGDNTDGQNTSRISFRKQNSDVADKGFSRVAEISSSAKEKLAAL